MTWFGGRPRTRGGSSPTATAGPRSRTRSAARTTATPAPESRALLDRLMALLAERDRRVLLMRFCDDMTQAEIGALLGVSQMQVAGAG
ncbi:MAG: sigma factor-like helix-turn-helix DNA-binding protein [Solirubrobacteraceae bacterium]